MSVPSAVVQVDWPTVIGGLAVFSTTCFTTYLGWSEARRRLDKKLPNVPPPGDWNGVPVPAMIVQDNQSVRESSLVMGQLRDQLVLNNHALDRSADVTERQISLHERVLDEMRLIRQILDQGRNE